MAWKFNPFTQKFDYYEEHPTKAAKDLLVGDVVRLTGGNKNAENLAVADVVELSS